MASWMAGCAAMAMVLAGVSAPTPESPAELPVGYTVGAVVTGVEASGGATTLGLAEWLCQRFGLYCSA